MEETREAHPDSLAFDERFNLSQEIADLAGIGFEAVRRLRATQVQRRTQAVWTYAGLLQP